MKKIMYIFIILVAFMFGNINVNAAKNLGKCNYTPTINGKQVTKKISFMDDGTVLGAETTNGSTNSATGNAIWYFKDDFDKTFFSKVYSDGQINTCPSIRICALAESSILVYPNSSRVCDETYESVLAKGEYVAPVGSDLKEQKDTVYCSTTKRLRNKSYPIKIVFFSRNNEQMYSITNTSNTSMAGEAKASEAITLDGYVYSLESDVISKYFKTQSSSTCSAVYLKAIDAGSTSHMKIQASKPDDVENGSYSVNDAEEDDGSSIDQKKDEDDKNIDNICDNMENTKKVIKRVVDIIKIAVPLLIIVLSIVDFIKILVSEEDKVYKSAWGKFIKRCALGAILILLPVLLKLILNISGVLGLYNIDSDSIFCIII